MNKYILHEDVPCWYELGFQSRPKPAIEIRVREEMLGANLAYLPKIMETQARDMKVDFQADLNKPIGFAKPFIRPTGRSGGFASFQFKIPYLRTKPEVCGSCKGTGKDMIDEFEACHRCRGRKKTRGYDWQTGKYATWSLAVFLWLLEQCEKVTASAHSQLLTLGLNYVEDRQMHQFPLGGVTSVSLVQWLASLDENKLLPECIDAMRLSYEAMVGKSESRYGNFLARAQSGGRFHMSVPGNCACLGSMDFYASMEKTGAKFDSQHDIAREAGV